MKILVIRNAFDHDFGGAERLAVHIANELKLNKLDTIVVSRQPRLLEYAKSQGVPTHRGWWWAKQNWSGLSLLFLPTYLVWQAILVVWYVQLIRKTHSDALHIMSKDDFIAGTVAAKLLGKTVVWGDCADLKYIYLNNPTWYKNPVGKIVRAVSRWANHITLFSHNEKRLIEESLGHPLSANYSVIHTAGKDEKVTPLPRKKEDKDAVIFAATSRMVVAKGIGELVQAFNKLSEGSSKYRLWLCGDGQDQPRFEKLAAGNPHIIFVGHTDKPLPYVAASDVFVQPTYNEAFSLSIAEAAMLGKPMIVTNVGGNPELVNEGNGLLIPVRDVEALYRAMEELGTDKKRREGLGRQARDDYKTKFDFARIIKEKYIPLYEKN